MKTQKKHTHSYKDKKNLKLKKVQWGDYVIMVTGVNANFSYVCLCMCVYASLCMKRSVNAVSVVVVENGVWRQYCICCILCCVRRKHPAVTHQANPQNSCLPTGWRVSTPCGEQQPLPPVQAVLAKLTGGWASLTCVYIVKRQPWSPLTFSIFTLHQSAARAARKQPAETFKLALVC